jgi:hypothetical protein
VRRTEQLAYQRGYHKGRLSNQQECEAIISENCNKKMKTMEGTT